MVKATILWSSAKPTPVIVEGNIGNTGGRWCLVDPTNKTEIYLHVPAGFFRVKPSFSPFFRGKPMVKPSFLSISHVFFGIWKPPFLSSISPWWFILLVQVAIWLTRNCWSCPASNRPTGKEAKVDKAWSKYLGSRKFRGYDTMIVMGYMENQGDITCIMDINNGL